jgi:SAM-dependent methyltransferase
MQEIPLVVSEKRLTVAAHEWLAEALFDGAFAVDATVGNGYDTLFLAHRVGPNGSVLGFDIQKPALAGAHELLRFTGKADRVKLVHECHSRIGGYLERDIDAAMFNLGYLPRGSHTLITRPETTVSALQSILTRLKRGGRITLLAYRGHQGGPEEYSRLREFLFSLSMAEYTVDELVGKTDMPESPRLFRIQRKSNPES